MAILIASALLVLLFSKQETRPTATQSSSQPQPCLAKGFSNHPSSSLPHQSPPSPSKLGLVHLSVQIPCYPNPSLRACHHHPLDSSGPRIAGRAKKGNHPWVTSRRPARKTFTSCPSYSVASHTWTRHSEHRGPLTGPFPDFIWPPPPCCCLLQDHFRIADEVEREEATKSGFYPNRCSALKVRLWLVLETLR